jgi:hypothetical protein
MTTTDTDIEALAERIIGCAIEVHRTLGPGLLECTGNACLLKWQPRISASVASGAFAWCTKASASVPGFSWIYWARAASSWS